MKVLILKCSALALGMFFISQVQAQPQRPNKEELFAKLDTNSDGFIDASEFKTAADQKQAKMNKKLDSKKSFDKIDENKNGTIEYGEYEKMMLARQENMKPKSPEEVFGTMDTDQDGKLNLEEFKTPKKNGKRK
ncbi:EF-hand domain-containing protein [Reichenbachiella carrageenanivorans]|uniref:EF-hand domain-containing protein n=1 Tax=Reichenbachiella carrageenanivorans TaxID=2979869 RepID=A0ABY6CWT1_9BACT|nr:EF-hand domain-containing protein [Reichenbachiella carrageenanivorans]UXX78370.1 EF-hand domain-containing protein [Reichenbachiella carrageenanivorans]